MKIRKMTASFGALQGRELSLGEGLNIVYAPNEQGKSTWCAFIKAMLYGIDSAQRAKGGAKPDKVKYLPWSGAPMEGTMTLTKDGRDIRITRRTKSAVSPMREFSAVYEDSGEPVPELTGADAGLLLTGENQAVFERSAFIRQAGVDVSGSPELEKRITALLSSGEEDTSFTEADERLRAWLRKRRHNQHGRLPELDAAIADKKARLEEMKNTAASAQDFEAEAQALEARRQALSGRVEESRKTQRRQALEAMAAARTRQQAFERQLEEAREAEAARQLAARETVFGDLPPDRAGETARAHRSEAEALLEAARRPLSPLVWIACLALALLCLGAGAVLSKVYFYGGALAFLAAGVFLLLDYRRKKTDAARALAEAKALLGRYGAEDPEEITRAYERYAQLVRAYGEARQNREAAARNLETLREQRKGEEARLLQDLDFSGGSSEAAELGRLLAQTEEAFQRLRERRAAAEGRLKAMGDPQAIGAELEADQALRARLQDQYDVIALAVEVLREANTQMRNRFSPRLSRKATAFMAALTGGAYDELTFDRDMSVRARRRGDIDGYDGDFVSAGTRDQIYLALRLAICELTGEEGSLPPIILDDALVNFDEERMGRALSLLRELGRRRQIILFTCHRREADYFEAGSGVTILELS